MKCSPILGFALAAGALAAAGCHPHHAEGHEHQPHKIVTTSPKVTNLTITQQYVSQIRSQQSIEVKPQVSGYLEEIGIKEGQAVKKGDVLFRVMPVLYKAKLDTEAAEAKQADLEYAFTKKLTDDKVVSPNELALYDAKRARAQARLKLAEAEMKFTTLTAPFDGIVDRLPNQLGSLVKESDVLTNLFDNRVMWVYFNVPEIRYYEYRSSSSPIEARQIELVLANGSKFPHPAQLLTITGKSDPQTGNIPFRADFPNPDGLLRHGLTGTVQVHRRLTGAVVIPQRATFEILDKQYVYVVDAEGVVHQRMIRVLHELEDVYVIGPGLGPDERIVVEGVREVHDGEKVNAEFKPADLVLGAQKFHAE
ncbi:MAG: efflux RND transporter periplasmic adaptor subunit [Gemmataceae bacterium]